MIHGILNVGEKKSGFCISRRGCEARGSIQAEKIGAHRNPRSGCGRRPSCGLSVWAN